MSGNNENTEADSADQIVPESLNNAAHDELVLKMQDEIGKEISAKIELVGNREPLTNLLKEYENDSVYKAKVAEIRKNYEYMRRMRPDGNCFFRAFCFGTLELILGKKDEIQSFRDKIIAGKEILTAAGFTQFTVDDFYDNFLDTIEKANNGLDEKGLEELFRNEGVSNYLVVFLRILTSAELKKSADFYQNFIEGDRTLDDFCQLEVEPMYKESDHIHIIALTKALGIGVRIVYMDRGAGLSEHNFPEDILPSLHLLYRPGHYDIIYSNQSFD